jgi:hypothetical protein
MTINHISQPDEFRHHVVKKLFDWARAGESVSVIGMSGVGKSNLFNHIRDPKTQARYLEGQEANTIIVRANFHYVPDFTDRSIYSLILEQLESLESEAARLGIESDTIEKISQYHEILLDAGADALKVQRYFKLAVRALLGDTRRRLVLLCDQFDDVYQEAEPRLFANLRGLREAYKYRLCYFIFTRDLLTNMVEMDAAREEFYELMASNILGLKPYQKSDAFSLLRRVSQRNQLALSDEMSEWLFALSGGHAGLLRAAYLGVAPTGLNIYDDGETAVSQLLQLPGVETECEKIWRSLSVHERRVLVYHAHRVKSEAPDHAVTRQLQIKGLLTAANKPQIFAPIFARYVADQEASWERPLYFDAASRQIWVLGQPAPKLTQLEYRLFHLLYQRRGEVVVKDELIKVGWPQAKGGVSDEALIAAIARLRKKIEPDSKTPRFLQNLHNQGYVLKIEDT